MLILDLLFGAWRPPTPARSRKYRVLGGNAKNKTPLVFAKTKIISVLTDDWKTNKQIADDADLQLNTVQQKTAKLFKAGKIDRVMQKTKSDTKPVCLYRRKDETPV